MASKSKIDNVITSLSMNKVSVHTQGRKILLPWEVDEFYVDSFCPQLHPMELLTNFPMPRSKLAKFLGVTPRCINAYACGSRKNPITPVQRLAAELMEKWSQISSIEES